MDTIPDIMAHFGGMPHIGQRMLVSANICMPSDRHCGAVEFVGIHRDERGDLCVCVRPLGAVHVYVVHPSFCTISKEV